MAKASELARVAPLYLGTPYKELDCQAFVERCLKDIGISKNLPGSNAWYREMTWTGTPEECKRAFGCIPVGAFLFILEQDGKEPEKYRPDGIGNASHIGIYTAQTAESMLEDIYHYIPQDEWKDFVKKVSHGDGAIHSSSSRGCVATSTFAGKTIKGGWNRIGLWTSRLDYGLTAEQTEQGEPAPVGDTVSVGMVYSGNGKPVKLRARPSVSCGLYWELPVGTKLDILGYQDAGWVKVRAGGTTGYMMEQFVQEANTDVTYTVIISCLTQQQSLDLLRQFPTADVQMERG